MVTASNGAVVDAGLVDLLEALWASGFQTEYSCEDFGVRAGDGWGYIKFGSCEDAARFCDAYRGHRRTGQFVDFPTTDIPVLTEIWGRR